MILELVHDNRSGQRLELVVPTYNEQKRIGNILHYYSDICDIVLLDDCSTDQTVEMAIHAGATVFRRGQRHIQPEHHFVHYVNGLSQSGMCFFLFADEYIEREALMTIERELRERCCVVYYQRVDWLAGRQMRRVPNRVKSPRGFYRGTAKFNLDSLHSALQVTSLPGRIECPTIFDVQHLQTHNFSLSFGSQGLYIWTEVEQFRRQKVGAYLFFKRYIVPVAQWILFRGWLNRKLGLARILTVWFEWVGVFWLALAAWLCQTYMPNEQQQLATYSEFYDLDATRNESLVA
jgi:glycosyltransferase involved in cell wall biosynthesis